MEDGATLKFDTAELREALQDAIRLSSSEMPVVIDRVARNLCFAAMRKTKTATVRGIEKYRNKPIMHATATKEGTRKMQGNRAAMNRIIDRRIQRRGYSKGLWLAAARDLGAVLKTNVGKMSHVKGYPAKEGVLPTAIIDVKGLASEHVARYMQPALDKALPGVLADMRKHAERQMAKIARQKSGRR